MMPLFAVVLPVLILFCGLSVDVGLLQLEKLLMQNAADAASLGAELEQERDTGQWANAGKMDAAVNGFTDGANNTTVTVALEATTGAYSQYYNAVVVTITKKKKTIFMGILNGGTVTLSASAVSLIPPCTSFLGSGALTQYSFYAASAGMNAKCPVYIDAALNVDGFANLIGIGLNVAGAAGASQVQGGGLTSQQGFWWAPGPPHYGVPVMPDPLAYIPSPSFSGTCDHTSYSITTGAATLDPGIFCGTSSKLGMTIINSNVTLNPGLYIITGGATWTNATVTGTGVTLFFTKGNGAAYGQLLIGRTGNKTSNITLSAPTSTLNGGIPGILFFADRNWIATSPMDFRLDTDGTFSGDGIWYLKNAGIYIWLNNSFSIPNYGGFVADNMYVFGTSLRPLSNYSSLPGGNPFRTQAVLVQ